MLQDLSYTASIYVLNFQVVYSDIFKPLMAKSFVSCEPLSWVEFCQTSDEVLEIVIKALHSPSDERFTGVVFVKSVPKCS